MLQADLLISAKWIIPIQPEGSILEDHTIVVRDKKILAVMQTAEAAVNVTATNSVELKNHVLIPGLVNAHGHSAMSLLRGFADDIPLQQWLEERIWPAEGRHVSPEFVKDGATLAIAEMIRSGTTCFADMYFYPDEAGKAAADANIRVQLASPVLDFPTVWAQDAEEYILKATQLHDDFRNNEFVYTAFGPHATYTVSDAPLQKLNMLAEELDVPIHMHIHETAQEVADAVKIDGRRPLQRLAELGLISPRLLCVHATQLLDEEINLLAENGSSVIHCPESNMKLASGFCEVGKLLDGKVNVALGTDGCASNNDLDMFSEMRSAALLAKVVSGDPSTLPAQKTLQLATMGGAKALGLDQLIGSLEPGKFADVTAINLDQLNSTPLYDLHSQLVYASQSSQVSHVWCGGKLVLADGELMTLDESLIKANAEKWQQKIIEESA